MEKQQGTANLSSNYTNSGYDADPAAGSSAPILYENEPSAEDYAKKIVEPPTFPPKGDEEPISFGSAPTAPDTDPRILKYNPPSLVNEEIYDACTSYVKEHCCYSSRFVNRMELTDINNGCAFYYTLESYGEKRESAIFSTPYTGGPIDGPENGRAPDPWEIYVPLYTAFVDMKTEQTIPHTDSVVTCGRCSGWGQVKCTPCSGSGRAVCGLCGGSGRRHNTDASGRRTSRICPSCGGAGRRPCSNCGATGNVTCTKCAGYGKIKICKTLYVTWTNHFSDFVSNIGQVPVKNIKKVSGDTILSEEKDQLFPINNAPEDSINTASASLLEAHRNSFTSEFIRKQRHSLRALPFTVARYKYKRDEGEFYIYGNEREVYFENYPTNCCCICF